MVLDTLGDTYLEEPRKMQPKMITKDIVRYRAFSGTLSFGCTWLKNGEAGRPPSLFLQSATGGFVETIATLHLPRKRIDHATAGCHNGSGSEEDTNKGEPVRVSDID